MPGVSLDLSRFISCRKLPSLSSHLLSPYMRWLAKTHLSCWRFAFPVWGDPMICIQRILKLLPADTTSTSGIYTEKWVHSSTLTHPVRDSSCPAFRGSTSSQFHQRTTSSGQSSLIPPHMIDVPVYANVDDHEMQWELRPPTKTANSKPSLNRSQKM